MSRSIVDHGVLLVWLGLFHALVVVVVVAIVALERRRAMTVLAALMSLSVVPRRIRPRWGVTLARAITRTAKSYFPCALTFENEEAYLKGARKGVGRLVGLEPHGALPLSVIAFADYFMFDEDGIEARGMNHAASMNSRALASGAIFHVPLVRHLWTWLGLEPISRRRMTSMLSDGSTCVIVPGGVAECMAMERGVETLYLKRRYGFVKIAIQTGAALVPAYTFGQTRAYKYWRLGPPLVPTSVANWFSKTFSFAPMVFWGKWFTPIPYATPLHTVVGELIETTQNDNPSREEVQAKLDEFIVAMRSLYDRHKSAHGYADVDLVVC
ncbi:Diacylglycerol acyltransferase [Ostreococcus tauri]|uniref:Acyltransferase n=1 Tax=Ostreococcus tauri TaxID=70448 RepID=Q00UG1_OSTTA|nr:Diacylglycerol acyltransferase [Ostreococcus tauri]OUS44248.1 putative mono-or diacylglycerol acyltransfe [Ostreococcus tauri]CAL58088.1 Diacylglycerol acyltransferase [Ostreococcus tauri]|eukprot:XP_003083539.1 Diacylglycerol acyltransferase [Ostreococcus tauri]